jgi:Flp pilus assembly pilin Flp
MLNMLNNFVIRLYTRVRVDADRGQALVEYVLILGLVSILAVGVLTNVGEALVNQLESVETAI